MATEQVRTLELGPHFTRFVDEMRAAWAVEQGATLTERGRRLLEDLLRETPEDEAWVAGLLGERPPARELYRDADYGFLQMGHFHQPGHGGAPHDHGPYWVLYGVYRGEIAINKYRRLDGGTGAGPTELEVVETAHLTPGSVFSYLPGEIHTPRSLAPEGSIVMRFLSGDVDAVERFRYKPLALENPLVQTELPPGGRYQAVFGR
jgi:predicted metal-dependent enzyme (double-stranded beta helix superfamily)